MAFLETVVQDRGEPRLAAQNILLEPGRKESKVIRDAKPLSEVFKVKKLLVRFFERDS